MSCRRGCPWRQGPAGRRTCRSPASRTPGPRRSRSRRPRRCASAGGPSRPASRSRAAASGPTPVRGASASSTPRIAVDGTSRCTANCALAVCSSRSALARVMPTSRDMSSIGSAVRWVSRSTLRWRGGQLPERVQRGPGLGVDVLLPGPPAGAAAALGPGPGQRAHVVLGLLEPRHLAPVVPGHDHGVAHGPLRGEQVAGERVGLEEQSAPDVLVEGFEAFWTPRVRAGKRAGHGRTTVSTRP